MKGQNNPTASVSSRVRRRTLLHTTGMRTRSPCTIRKKRPRRWLKPFLPCGNTDRAPISPRWHRCVCCIRHRPSSIRLSRNAAATRCRPRPTSAGIGHRRRWKDSRQSKHGSTRQPAEPCRKRPRHRRIKCVPL